MEIKFFKIAPLLFAPIILPASSLLVWLGVAMVLDLVSGVTAAAMNGRKITSTGYRGTVKKFSQYGSAIGISILLANLAESNQDQAIEALYGYFSSGMLIFIIFIEIKSILENAIEISPQSDFTKLFLTPIHTIISLEFLSKFIKQEPK